MSGNLEGAKRERDLMLARARELSGPKPSIEDLQREGRERWLALRAEQKAKEQAPEKVPERAIEKAPEAGRSLDEERQQAAERWREYRRAQELEKDREPSQAPERKGPEKDRGLERDGPELE